LSASEKPVKPEESVKLLFFKVENGLSVVCLKLDNLDR
jgi:hypothetical protein